MTATTLGLSQTEYVVLGILWMASLVPVVWAIADMARRPVWQFPRSRKALWTIMLSLGVVFLWPVGPGLSILYLVFLRRRFPPAGPGQPLYGHRFGAPGPFGRYGGPRSAGPYGSQGPYGSPGGPGPYGSGPYGPGPAGQDPYRQQGQQGSPAPGPYGADADPYGYRPPPASLPAAGWYPDPAGSGQERWWDGRGWTHHLRDAPSP